MLCLMTYLAQTFDQRRFKRIDVELPVRFLLGEAQHAARVTNMSLGGAAFSTRVRPRIGARIVAYIDRLERFEGVVVRLFRRGFAIQFSLPDAKRKRVADILMLIANKIDPANALGRRRTARMNTKNDVCACVFGDGGAENCRISDISIMGASIMSRRRPRIGSTVRFRQSEARVVRHTKGGFAVEFPEYWRNISPWQSWRTYD